MSKSFLLILILITTIVKSQQNNNRLAIADQMEYSLKNELLKPWYPASIDTMYGGFISAFTYDFKLADNHDKMIVTQARHVWTNSKAAELYPDVTYFKEGAAHGFRFLKDVMWDKTYGGFYLLTDRKGIVKSTMKEAYGNAFGIYALAAYYHESHDTSALNLAKQAFIWLDNHSHDSQYKGYYQHLNRDGSVIKRDASVPSTSDLGYKDQNSSIHLLEAFSELYQVWPDNLLRSRLQEMLFLIRDVIMTKKGHLQLFFQPDWTPVSFKDSSEASLIKHKYFDHVSFGHDVETACLMLEASQVLGLTNDTITKRITKNAVDHALQNGWDNKIGGFYDEGYYYKNKNAITIIRDSKNWWAQAEGLNTLLLMADAYPNDNHQYYQKFLLLWNYVQTYLIDHEHGDWYEGGLDKEPEKATAQKGHIWKATYHNFRGLDNCIRRLRHAE
ncbi:cellobiose 2-epimerase [soil metagenome]